MDIFSKDDFDELMDISAPPCLSIYLPTFKKGRETRQNSIRYKNLLSAAAQQLQQLDDRFPAGKDFLAPAESLLDNFSFSRTQDLGLAVFVTPDGFWNYRLPLEFPEIVIVADRPHLKPLLPLVQEDGTFFVLGFNQEQATLYRCTRQTIDPVDVPDMPRGLEEITRFDDVEKQFQFYSGAAPAKGHTRGAVFFGQDVVNDLEKERLQRYCQAIDSAVRKALQGETAPLVLSAIESLPPIYRQANTYPHLHDMVVPKNPDALSLEELHDHAWETLAPLRERAFQRALNRYNDFIGTGKTSNDLATILQASFQGRVDQLFAALDTYRWGVYHVEEHALNEYPQQRPGSLDLIDMAVSATLKNGGRVFPLQAADDRPDIAPVAALFRF